MTFDRSLLTLLFFGLLLGYLPVIYGGNWWYIYGAFIFVVFPIALWKEYSKPLDVPSEIHVRDHSHYSPGPLHRKVLDGEHMYSELLLKVVKLCCYQTARLGDKYCVCGRGLVYPIDVDQYT